MQLDELKKSMSTLDKALSMIPGEIKIDKSVSRTAQSRLLKIYKTGYSICVACAIILFIAWIEKINVEIFPQIYKISLIVLIVVEFCIYLALYWKLKSIDVATITPTELINRIGRIKLANLIGDLTVWLATAVLFTLMYSHVLTVSPILFWISMLALVAVIVWTVCHYWPTIIRLYREINSIYK